MSLENMPRKKSHKDYTLYDFMYMKYPEKASQQRQKVDQWLSKAERNGWKQDCYWVQNSFLG